jgi:hypothetical protein
MSAMLAAVLMRARARATAAVAPPPCALRRSRLLHLLPACLGALSLTQAALSLVCGSAKPCEWRRADKAGACCAHSLRLLAAPLVYTVHGPRALRETCWHLCTSRKPYAYPFWGYSSCVCVFVCCMAAGGGVADAGNPLRRLHDALPRTYKVGTVQQWRSTASSLVERGHMLPAVCLSSNSCLVAHLSPCVCNRQYTPLQN